MPRYSRPLAAAAVSLSVLSLAAIAVFAANRSSDPPSAVIVAAPGPFASPEEAARSEAGVNWSDGRLDDDDACTVGFAATELQGYLRRISGRPDDFPMVRPESAESAGAALRIRLGTFDQLGPDVTAKLGLPADAAAALGDDGYVIKTISPAGGASPLLVIAGPTRRGVLYGAYDLLHRLGVRWISPGPDGEEVPAAPLRPFPAFDARESPRMTIRGYHAWENRAPADFLTWMARNRLNFWCVEQSGKPFLHKLGFHLVGGAHMLTSFYLNPKGDYPYDHPRQTGDEGRPADPYAVPAEFRGDTDGNGRLSYFEAHPEWFGLQEGKRSDRIWGDEGDNFCTSNPDAMAEWTKNAVEDLASGRYKDADVMNAWALDVGTWCECARCRALGTPTDRNLLWVHAYAQAVARARAEERIHRKISFLFLTYADVIDPPTRPLPADFDYSTCFATYFPIERCFVHRIDDPACSMNAPYWKGLAAWVSDPARFYRGAVLIGEYYNVSGFKSLPVCFAGTMGPDISAYARAGARGLHYMHVTTSDWGNKALTNWQMARMLWDPAADPGTLLDDYFSSRYGPAAGPMRRFYKSLETMLSNVRPLKYGLARRLQALGLENGGAAAGTGARLFTDPHLRYDATTPPKPGEGPSFRAMIAASRTCRERLAEARAIAAPERVARRIDEDEARFAYGEKTLQFYDDLVRASFALNGGRAAEAGELLAAARRLAGDLEADYRSTTRSSSHANAANALEASLAAPALVRLEKRLAALGTAVPAGRAAAKETPMYADKSDLMTVIGADGAPRPVSTPADWSERRAHIVANFEKVAGPFPTMDRRIPVDLRILSEQDLGDVIRKKVTYAPEPDDRLSAWVFVPKDRPGRSPAVLCLHQTSPLGKDEPAGMPGGKPDLAMALELARRGYVTIAPDYPGFGEYKIDPYAMGYVSATMKGIWNHMRAVDLLFQMPEVDPERVAVAGHSLGGHNSIFVALYDPRIKAVVTSCGFTAFPSYYGGDLTGWSHKGYMPRIASVYGKDPARMPFDFTELLGALAPRPVFVNAPLRDANFDAAGVDACARAAAPVYRLLGAPDALKVVHPDVEHAFPPEVRAQAWEWLDAIFGKRDF